MMVTTYYYSSNCGQHMTHPFEMRPKLSIPPLGDGQFLALKIPLPS